VQANFEKKSIFGKQSLIWKKTTSTKSSMCEEKPHAKEENMKGAHARKPNHVRVRFFVRDCNR
jgi:hypothetical protein